MRWRGCRWPVPCSIAHRSIAQDVKQTEELSLREMLVSWMLDGLNSLLHDRFFCPCLSPHYSGAKGTATARGRRSVGLLMRLWRLAERVARLARFVGGGVVLLYMLMLNAAEVI